MLYRRDEEVCLLQDQLIWRMISAIITTPISWPMIRSIREISLLIPATRKIGHPWWCLITIGPYGTWSTWGRKICLPPTSRGMCQRVPVSTFILIPFSNIFIAQLAPLSLLSPYVSLRLLMQSLRSRCFSLHCRHPHSFPSHPPHDHSQDTKSKIYW